MHFIWLGAVNQVFFMEQLTLITAALIKKAYIYQMVEKQIN